ncbi:hypothetical protein Tco_0499656 [Tanacetum coccineum]
MHNNIMAAGSRDRPPMLATGRYAQWRSRFLRYIDTRPNGDALRKCILKGPYTPTIVTTPAVPATEDSPAVPEQTTVETVMNMTPENRAHFESEKEAIHLILMNGFRDEIYSTVVRSQTLKEMWEVFEGYNSVPEQAQRDKDMQKKFGSHCKIENASVMLNYDSSLTRKRVVTCVLLDGSLVLIGSEHHLLMNLNSAEIALMAKLSRNGSDALTEVHNPDNLAYDLIHSTREQIMSLLNSSIDVIQTTLNITSVAISFSYSRFSGSNEQYAEIERLKQTLSEQVQEKDSLMKTVSDLKNDLKMEENRNINREID